MATVKTPAKKTAPPATGKAMVNWDAELAKYAEASQAQEDTAIGGGMKYFSLKSGVLSYDDAALHGNHMGTVVLDSIFEHAYYAEKYDPDAPAAPTCFALGRDEGEMVPHPSVVARGQQQHATCAGCPMNEFGSADTGRGKACKNVRRLALIPAGAFNKQGAFTLATEMSHYAKTPLAFLKVPVTSANNFKTYVKQVAQSLRRPLFAVATEVSLVPDAKTQFQVRFEALDEIPTELMEPIVKRVEEAHAVIDTPYDLDREPAEKPVRGRGKAPAKSAVKGKGKGRKY